MTDPAAEQAIGLPAGDTFARADLVFSGVDHSGPSYQVLVHLTGVDAQGSVVGQVDAGSYYVFGHGGCFGDDGHCDVSGPVSPYDYRPPHQLHPAIRLVTATDEIKALIAAGAVSLQVRATPVVKESPFATAESAQGIVVATDVELRFYS